MTAKCLSREKWEISEKVEVLVTFPLLEELRKLKSGSD